MWGADGPEGGGVRRGVELSRAVYVFHRCQGSLTHLPKAARRLAQQTAELAGKHHPAPLAVYGIAAELRHVEPGPLPSTPATINLLQIRSFDPFQILQLLLASPLRKCRRIALEQCFPIRSLGDQ